MGGDDAPAEPVKGAAKVSLSQHDVHLILVGDEAQIEDILAGVDHDRSRITIHATTSVIPMDANPRKALREMPEASLPETARLVAEGEADAMVSAGNTGAVILTCADHFKRLEGVGRCALGAVFPTERRRGEKNDPFSLILDVGLTLEVTADDLVTFAIMGEAYAHRISKNPSPRVALLSNGSEPNKGTAAIVEAHARLKNIKCVNFIGNIEGMDIPHGTADVVITDGFTGNIVLKMFEGVAKTVMNLGRYAFRKNLMYKAGLTLLAPAVKQLKEVTDWEHYGGAPILGFDRVCIKAHGRSSERAIKNALKVARKTVETDLVDAIQAGLLEGLAEARGERTSG
jgi:glycerol-3-phosphate acyltransferase PlsX